MKVAYITLTVLFAVWMLNVWIWSDITEESYKLKALELERRYVKSEIDKLQLEIIALESPARISQIATDELGMVRISSHNLIRLEKGRKNWSDDRP